MMYILLALVPVIGLIINIMIHILSFRFRMLPQLKSIICGFISGIISVVIFTFLFCQQVNELVFLPQLLLNELSYIFLGYCYFHFVNLGETARRIRIIREISESENSRLSETEILSIYNAKKMVQVRLKRLRNNGQILEKDEKYYLNGSPAMKIIAVIILSLKVFLLGKKSEQE